MDPLVEKRKIRLFSKSYKEMQTGVNKTLKRGNDKVYSVKSIEEIDRFVKQIDENEDLYKNQDLELFNKVVILKRCFYGKPALNAANKTVVWKFIHVLYSLGAGENKVVPIQSSSNGMGGLGDLVDSLVNDKDSGFKDMIEDISKQLEDSMKGKNIDQATLVSDLMNGNLQTSGIDFQSIIEKTTHKLKEKVDNGEVDIEKLRIAGDKIKTAIPGNFMPSKK